jgi:hypothetical protein
MSFIAPHRHQIPAETALMAEEVATGKGIGRVSCWIRSITASEQKTSKSAPVPTTARFETSRNQRIATAASTEHTRRRFPSELDLLARKFWKLAFETNAASESQSNLANRNFDSFSCCLTSNLLLLVGIDLVIEGVAQRAGRASIQALRQICLRALE